MYISASAALARSIRCFRVRCARRCTATAVAAVRLNSRCYTSMSGPATDTQTSSDAAGYQSGEGYASPGTTSPHATPSASSRRYQRRSSDPKTLRERGDFQRDYKYGKYRPLVDLPWRQHKRKSYLDEAERLYGRKESWQSIADPALRERLIDLLQDYIRDVISAMRLETQQAYRYKALCDRAASDYGTHVIAGGYGNPSLLRQWATQQVMRCASKKTAAGVASGDDGHAIEVPVDGEVCEGNDDALPRLSERGHDTAGEDSASSTSLLCVGGVSNEVQELQRQQQRLAQDERRRRGERASVMGSTATMDLPSSDVKHRPRSAFPFLRQRALEQEHTLDPSLVDWTAKFYPDDDDQTFAHPPPHSAGPVRGGEAVPQTPGGAEEGGQRAAVVTATTLPTDKENTVMTAPDGKAAVDVENAPRASRVHARVRLQSSLKMHYDRRRVTFDAEGMFYQVRPPITDDTSSRAPKPREVRGSDLIRHGMDGLARRSEVVKVPWDIVTKARQQGYSSDILRAKERLIRLTRGEDPETIP